MPAGMLALLLSPAVRPAHPTLLRHNEHVSICIGQAAVVHVGGGRVHVYGVPRLLLSAAAIIAQQQGHQEQLSLDGEP